MHRWHHREFFFKPCFVQAARLGARAAGDTVRAHRRVVPKSESVQRPSHYSELIMTRSPIELSYPFAIVSRPLNGPCRIAVRAELGAR